jgi:archaellum biogenesis ATPase FlaH
MKKNRKSIIHSVKGEALDQETVIRLRSKIENYIRDDMQVTFKYTKVIWNKNEHNDNFNFIINFYA